MKTERTGGELLVIGILLVTLLAVALFVNYIEI